MLFRSTLFFVFSALASAAAATFPALTYSTYLLNNFTPNAIALDPAGNIYLAGNDIVNSETGQTTVLVLKLNPQATEILYERYIGGSAMDNANAIALDGSGSVYIAGVTTSLDFPVTGGNLATPPSGATERSFVTKLSPTGNIVFSMLLGGSTNSEAQAVAVNASGQVLVSGMSFAGGFPSTPGVYSVNDTNFQPYLLELDPTGTQLIFSATGIGGNAIAFDSSGNIYMAGTTNSLTYPTTPGSYQPSFPVFQTCFAPCMSMFQGPNQYVTKLDPTGTKMIFSTAVSGNGGTLNEGLAVDASGNVYLTGLAGVSYPYTVAVPTPPAGPAVSKLATPALPFLSKLDPTGQKLLYSVPVGGIGVQVDPHGVAYVGGILGAFSNYDVAAGLPALSYLPSACTAPDSLSDNSAYVSQVDATGNVLGSRFLGGSSLTLSGVALSGSTLWTAGSTLLPDFPFSPNALSEAPLTAIPLQGAFLGAVNFAAAQPPTGSPQIGCVFDAASFASTGPIVPNQLLTIFGNDLGPATPATATNNSTTSLGGVSVTFASTYGSFPAPLLYVSAHQINLAVPLVSVGSGTNPGTTLQVTVNGVSSPPLQFPTTNLNPSLYGAESQTGYQLYFLTALNADGTLNSATNPAQLGSMITIFGNGIATDPDISETLPQLSVTLGWSVTSIAGSGPFVVAIKLQVPSYNDNFLCPVPPNTSTCAATFSLTYSTNYLNPFQPDTLAEVPFGGTVYVQQ